MKKLLFLSCALALAACSSAKMPSDLNDEKVFFAFDSAEITPEMSKNLQGQALYMKKHPDVNITMEGHCDERGSTEYNLALGALRAGNAAHVLIKDGVEPSRIKTISYGKNKPQYFGTGEAVWAKNRNATTKVNK
ncbi:OmpA family protein [bacterium]|nr:OmpA family protein [bacterium]